VQATGDLKVAELTNSEGTAFRFDPKAVAAVADHDDVGDAATVVYGVIKAPQRIDETVDGFLTRIGVKAKLAKLTRIPATGLWVSPDAVDYLRPALAGDSDGANCVISIGGNVTFMKDTFDGATAALNAVGGKF
jgi:hypothetical protein